jgi:hypothetical protein
VISVIFGPGPALYHWTVQYNGTTRPTRVPIGPCLGLRVDTPGKPGMTRRLPVSCLERLYWAGPSTCRAGPGSTFGHLYTNLKTKKTTAVVTTSFKEQDYRRSDEPSSKSSRRSNCYGTEASHLDNRNGQASRT